MANKLTFSLYLLFVCKRMHIVRRWAAVVLFKELASLFPPWPVFFLLASILPPGQSSAHWQISCSLAISFLPNIRPFYA